MLLTEIFAKLGLDVDSAAFAKGQLAVEGLKVAFGLLKRAAEAALNLAPATADYAHHIGKVAHETGIGTTALQELAYASGLSDVGLDDLSHSLGFLARNMNAAAQGGKEQAKAFDQLHVAVKDAHGALRPTDQVLGDIADKFKALPDGPKKSALSMELFGRAGRQMIPFLDQGRAGIAGLRKEANDLGVVLDEGAIKQGEEAARASRRMSAAWDGLKLKLGVELLPAMLKVTTAITDFLKAHKTQIIHAFRVVIDAVRFAFRLLWAALWPVRVALGFVADHMREVAIVIGAVLLQAIAAAIPEIILLGEMFGVMALDAVAAAATTAAAWASALLPFVLLAAIIDDLMVGLDPNGGKSVIIPAIVAAAKALKDAFKSFFDWIKGPLEWVTHKLEDIADLFAGSAVKAGLKQMSDKVDADQAAALPPGARQAMDVARNIANGGRRTDLDSIDVTRSFEDGEIRHYGTDGNTRTAPVTMAPRVYHVKVGDVNVNAPNADAGDVAARVHGDMGAGIAAAIDGAR